MNPILVTGARGQVGVEVCEKLLILGYKVISCGHSDLDITSENEVSSLFESTPISLVINCAAYTAVDKAEDEEKAAYAVNALGPKNLALECKERDIPLIHISTDYVYDNGKPGLHLENESTGTRCVYGKTKLFGERFILDSGVRAVILRASWIFGRYGKNFVKAMANLAASRDTLKVVCDEFGNPTPARALADDICYIADSILNGSCTDFGVYNYCGYPSIVRNDFARVILDKAREIGMLSHDVEVLPITSEEFGAKAKRPADSRMNSDKFANTFRRDLPDWRLYLEETLRGL
ncbi:dTDP-4-dehydrorhamnose reductase [Succinivibrio dextrinosolvens]|uniref:dTDP-4-dehydrorhamnose reductase n=1 Tax=Succinivibrio dextrinosolvens TaxID=83771 RepID=UPI002479B6B9|nr:dTDP-4-dehydrorhamnose reductase [Succinivibrio dextrinosolvens]